MNDRRIYTIGHSTGPYDHFIGLLRAHAVSVVADVRSEPSSRFAPEFHENWLGKYLPLVGIHYVSLGRELGGRPADLSLYDKEGRVLYWRLAETDAFQRGIERVIDGIGRYRVALMCSEEDPVFCHRRLLVGRVLLERGADVVHIRASGELEFETETALRFATQQGLFERESEWRSIRSVLGTEAQRSSSAHSAKHG